MAIPMRQDQQQDADAVYVRDRIATADRLEAEGKAEEQSGSTKRKQAEQERIAAGLRLIEVRAKFPDRTPSGKQGFADWYESNGLARNTVYNLMKLAGAEPEEREEQRKKERERKREERSKERADLGWVTVLKDELGYIPGCKNKKAEYEEKMGEVIPAYFKTGEEAGQFVQRFVAKVGLPEGFKREQLPKSSEEKVQRAIRVETGLLHKQFHDAVAIEVSKQLEQKVAHIKMLQTKAEEAKANYDLRASGIAAQIAPEDYKFLLNVLHPDRAPDDRKEKFSKAFNIVRKLDAYIKAFA